MASVGQSRNIGIASRDVSRWFQNCAHSGEPSAVSGVPGLSRVESENPSTPRPEVGKPPFAFQHDQIQLIREDAQKLQVEAHKASAFESARRPFKDSIAILNFRGATSARSLYHPL